MEKRTDFHMPVLQVFLYGLDILETTLISQRFPSAFSIYSPFHRTFNQLRGFRIADHGRGLVQRAQERHLIFAQFKVKYTNILGDAPRRISFPMHAPFAAGNTGAFQSG